MKQLKFWGLLILILVCFLEVLLRIFFPLPEISNLDRVNFYNVRAKAPMVYLRGQPWYWTSELDTNHQFIHHMNAYGFRDQEWTIDKKDSTKRFLFFGDSFTEGIMAEQNEAFPSVLQDILGDKVQVMNAGMVGTGPSQQLQLACDIIPIFKPDWVFFVVYANDFGKNPPIIPSYYLEPEFSNHIQLRAISLWNLYQKQGSIPKAFYTNVKPFIGDSSEIANPFNNADFKPNLPHSIVQLMKKGKVNHAMINQFLKEEYFLKQQPNLGEYIPYIKYLAKKYKFYPVVLYLPSKNQVSPYYKPFAQVFNTKNIQPYDLTAPQYQIHAKALSDACYHFQIPFFDFTNAIKAQEQINGPLYWRYDEHMNAKGYAFIAKTIAERIR